MEISVRPRSGRLIRMLMLGVAMSALMAGTPSQSQTPGTPPQETQAKIPDDPISYDSLTLEIALARKTLADERFLANDLTGC